MRRWCKNPPKDVTRMAMSPDGRYVYCLGQTVFVFDRLTGGKQRLPDMGNTAPFVSRDGRFMGGVHPCRTAKDTLEVALWRVGETHEEILPRVRIRSQIPPIHPCFTADGAYILLDACPTDRRTKSPLSQLWAVSTADGSTRMLFQAPEHMTIRSVDASEGGVLLVVQDAGDYHAQCQLMWFKDADAAPKVIPVDREGLLDLPADLDEQATVRQYWRENRTASCRACWLPDGRALLGYKALALSLQTVGLAELDCIHPKAELTLPCSHSWTLSQDGQYITVNTHKPGTMTHLPSVYRLSDGQLTWSLPSRFLWDIRFSPDSQWLLVSGEEAWMEPREEFASE